MSAIVGRTAGASEQLSVPCPGDGDPVAAAICGDRLLASLDRDMTALYKQVTDEWSGEALAEAKSEQRAWWKARAACTASPSLSGCIEETLIARIAELKAYFAPPAVPSSVSRDVYERELARFDRMVWEKQPWRAIDDALWQRMRLFPRQMNRDEYLLYAEFALRYCATRIMVKDLEGIYKLLDRMEWRILDKSQSDRYDKLRSLGLLLMLTDLSDPALGDASNRLLETANKVLTLGYQYSVRRRLLAPGLIPEVQATAARYRAQIEAEAAAAREAEARRQAALAAQAEAERKAQEAKERQEQEERERREHRTVRYQLGLISGAFLASWPLIWKYVPGWVYPAAALIGFLFHRHLLLRITLAFTAFCQLAFFAIEPRSAWAFLSSWVEKLFDCLKLPFNYDPDISLFNLSASIALSYIYLSLAIYVIALRWVGREVRAAEAYRLSGFVPAWAVAWRYAFAQRWAERSERQRQLRQARHEAKLTALQIQAQQPQAAGYPYPPQGKAGGGAVRSFFEFSRATVSLVKWALIAGSLFLLVRFGDGIMDKASALAEKITPLIQPLLQLTESL